MNIESLLNSPSSPLSEPPPTPPPTPPLAPALLSTLDLPSTPKRSEMTRDHRIEARTLYRIGWRCMPYWKVLWALEWEGISESAVRSGLRRVGYKRYVALRKPLILEKNRQLRLEFALEHVNWSDEQWDAILRSDETWVTPGSHRKTYVTRLKSEVLEPTCILERERKKKG